MNNTKTTLIMPESPNNFEIKQNSKYRIQPIYIQGILYPKKENM